MTKAARIVYTVRQARNNLLNAIRIEKQAHWRGGTYIDDVYVSSTTAIARREAAIRDLIASVRTEARDAE